MKKHLILLLLAGLFSLNACSSDDDGGNGDPILGTWAVVAVTPPIIDTEACPEASTITFNEDNTGNAIFYLESNDCEAQTSTGTWENLGSGNYRINVPVSGMPSLSGRVEFNGANEFFFISDDGIQFTFQKR